MANKKIQLQTKKNIQILLHFNIECPGILPGVIITKPKCTPFRGATLAKIRPSCSTPNRVQIINIPLYTGKNPRAIK
jgi:hypothetical protein